MKKYYVPVKHKFNSNTINSLKELIDSNLKQNSVIGLVYFKYYSGVKKTEIIKKVKKNEKDYYLRAFTNQLFSIKEEICDSIVLVLRPIQKPIQIERSEIKEDFDQLLKRKNYQEQIQALKQFGKKYDSIDSSVFQKFISNKQNYFYKLTNDQDDKCQIINCDIEGGSDDLEESIADEMMKDVVAKINRQSHLQSKLLLIKMKSSARLANIQYPDRITDIEIQDAQLSIK